MANSVHRDRQGPDWPLGNIVVPVPGTPVSIMSLVDSGSVDAPETAVGASSAEYPPRAYQITFTGVKAGAGPPALANNTGIIYVLRKGAAGGTGNKTDLGTIVGIISPGGTFVLTSAPLNRNTLNPYRYFVDADTANDGCQVTLLIQ